ncbi:MAG: CopG family transcriptional regulator [Erysipelotrichia bacterium]|nr:CopG family transcriptional regulator [Erysipelotrichia bacterium]
MAISLRVTKEEEKLFRDYAKFHGITVSELIRTAVLEKIENEIDINDFDESLKIYQENKKIYSLSEITKGNK